MLIQLNTDNNINGGEGLQTMVTDSLNDALSHYAERITRVEAHFGDENGGKDAPNDKRCMLEARLEGMTPVAVTSHGDNLHMALDSAIDKLKASLETRLGKERNY
jgi:Sigma 54 modulation protein / S30EA ribosomal protein.